MGIYFYFTIRWEREKERESGGVREGSEREGVIVEERVRLRERGSERTVICIQREQGREGERYKCR